MQGTACWHSCLCKVRGTPGWDCRENVVSLGPGGEKEGEEGLPTYSSRGRGGARGPLPLLLPRRGFCLGRSPCKGSKEVSPKEVLPLQLSLHKRRSWPSQVSGPGLWLKCGCMALSTSQAFQAALPLQWRAFSTLPLVLCHFPPTALEGGVPPGQGGRAGGPPSFSASRELVLPPTPQCVEGATMVVAGGPENFFTGPALALIGPTQGRTNVEDRRGWGQLSE